MAADAVATGELDRAEEDSEGSPIPTLEPALRRAPSASSRADHKGEWSSLGHKSVINRSENFRKNICLASKR